MTNNTNEYKYSFFPQTISQWNILPLVYSETVDSFKHGWKDPNSPP